MNNNHRSAVDQILGERLAQMEVPATDAPDQIREEVFSTIDTLSFLAELADFFTVRFTESEWAMLEAVSDGMFRPEEGG